MALVCSWNISAAITHVGDVITWGRGDDGQLGSGALTHHQQPARVISLGQLGSSRILMLAAGCRHQVAVAEDGAICTWGCGGNGRLGHGDEDRRKTPTRLGRERFGGSPVVMVSCGAAHTLALTTAGCAFTCGQNSFGQLGHGDTADRRLFTLVGPGRFGKDRVIMAASGYNHNAVVTTGGGVWTWGRGLCGRLGHYDEQDRHTPALLAPEQFDGCTFVLVAAGTAHTVAVGEDGTPWVWGQGMWGQLGLGDACGRLAPTRLGKATFRGSGVHMAACGFCHTLFVTKAGELWACGEGVYGQLGLSDRVDRHVPTRVDPQHFAGSRIIAVSGGDTHTAALAEDGAVYTWGQGAAGVERPPSLPVPGGLGHLDLIDRLVPTIVSSLLFDGALVGRCHTLNPEHALAFAMGTHFRLGGGFRAAGGGGRRRSRRLQGRAATGRSEEDAVCGYLFFSGDLVRLVVEVSGWWPEGAGVGLREGVLRLMGGSKGKR